jgi:hypothetical protein
LGTDDKRFDIAERNVIIIGKGTERAGGFLHAVHSPSLGAYPEIAVVFGEGTHRHVAQAAVAGVESLKYAVLIQVNVAQLAGVGTYPDVGLTVFAYGPYGIIGQAEGVGVRMLIG